MEITQAQCLPLTTQVSSLPKAGFILRLLEVAKQQQKLQLTCFQLQVLQGRAWVTCYHCGVGSPL